MIKVFFESCDSGNKNPRFCYRINTMQQEVKIKQRSQS